MMISLANCNNVLQLINDEINKNIFNPLITHDYILTGVKLHDGYFGKFEF